MYKFNINKNLKHFKVFVPMGGYFIELDFYEGQF